LAYAPPGLEPGFNAAHMVIPDNSPGLPHVLFKGEVVRVDELAVKIQVNVFNLVNPEGAHPAALVAVTHQIPVLSFTDQPVWLYHPLILLTPGYDIVPHL